MRSPIRFSGIDRRTALTGRVAVSGVPNVRLQGFQADVRGWFRHLAAPCVGAFECGMETGIARDAGGRIVRCLVAGRLYGYAYDARGQLVEHTDHTDTRLRR